LNGFNVMIGFLLNNKKIKNFKYLKKIKKQKKNKKNKMLEGIKKYLVV